MSVNGYISFVLHAHIPYVLNHGSWPHGTDWLNEAAAESHIPLLDVCNSLFNEGVRANIVLNISPILAYQVSQKEFKEGFKSYLRNRIDSAHSDYIEFEKNKDIAQSELALMWGKHFTDILRTFTEKYNEDIVGAFRELKEKGAVEIISSCATHGYLPLIGDDTLVRLQINLGIEVYRKYFGEEPSGFWLPECAYRPANSWEYPVKYYDEIKDRKGIEDFLQRVNVKYFFVDSHMITGGRPEYAYSSGNFTIREFSGMAGANKIYAAGKTSRAVYNPYVVSSSSGQGGNILVFPRDSETSLQVWSGEWGYPGDSNYLEFHKKHFPGGHRYWKITNAERDLGSKEVYDPEAAKRMTEEHAKHFKELIKKRLSGNDSQNKNKAVIVSMFDAELFGHWWFEGPRWIESLCRMMHTENEVELITCTEYLKLNEPSENVFIPEGSWGEGGSHRVWFNGKTKWIWECIYKAERKFCQIYTKTSNDNIGPVKPYMEQMLKELLLLQSSDWQFLISTSIAQDYAEKRIDLHFQKFELLSEACERMLSNGAVNDSDRNLLDSSVSDDGIFSDIDILSFYNP